VSEREVRIDDDAAERLMHAFLDEIRQADVDARHLHALDNALRSISPAPIRLDIPAFPYDVHDLKSLDDVACVLVANTISN
jgi:hypothetical protein